MQCEDLVNCAAAGHGMRNAMNGGKATYYIAKLHAASLKPIELRIRCPRRGGGGAGAADSCPS